MGKNNSNKVCMALLFISICGMGCGKKPESRMVEGLDNYVREEYNSSLVVFNKILNDDPKNINVLFYRAMVHKKNSDTEKSVLDFERVFEIDKNFNIKEQDLYSIAEYNYTRRKDYKKAIDQFRFFINKYPKSGNTIRAYIEIADCYSLQKDFDKAIEGYKKVIEVYGLGKLSVEKRATSLAEDGVKFLKENSDFDRKPLSLFADMGNERDPLKKIEIGNKILEKYPNCNLADDVQYKIAKLYSVDGLNDFDKAQIEYQKLITRYPKSKFIESAKNSIMGIDEKYDRKTGKLKGKIH